MPDEEKKELVKEPVPVPEEPAPETPAENTELDDLMAKLVVIQEVSAARALALDTLVGSGELGGFVYVTAVQVNEARAVKDICEAFGITIEELSTHLDIAEADAEEDEDEGEEDDEVFEDEEEPEEAPALPPKPAPQAAKKKSRVLDTAEEFLKG